jgi:uncharacterized membrane protein YdbT with pleckstrin-like domain
VSYVDRSLGPEEAVRFRTRLSAVMFVMPVIVACIGVVLSLISNYSAVHYFGLFVLAVAVIMFLIRYISYTSSEFAVTNRRVIIKVGVIQRRTLELQLAKVEAIAVNQSIVGRIFGYGDIVVTGTGGTKEPFHMIGAPLEFSRAVQTSTA